MLYIISEIKKSLFIDTQVCPLTCAFLTPSKVKEKRKTGKITKQKKTHYNSLLLWIQDEWEKKNRKQHWSESLFFLSQGSYKRVLRGIVTLFTCRSVCTAETEKSPGCQTGLLKKRGQKKKKQQKILYCMCPLFRCKELKVGKNSTARTERFNKCVCGFNSMQCAERT